MDIDVLKSTNKVIGTKQTIKFASKDQLSTVIIAKDAQKNVINPLLELCSKGGIPVHYVDSMKELGSICGINVATATAGILK